MTAVVVCYLWGNSITGVLPESGLRTLSAVTNFQVSKNSFKGALPENGLQVMRVVSKFYLHTNGFTGLLPESGLGTMSSVKNFQVSTNIFEGALSSSGLRAMQAVSVFYIHMNSFTGPLPESGLRTLSAVANFQVAMNIFEGALPERGLQAMRVVSTFGAFVNRFTGPLPESGLGTMSKVTNFRVSTNSFKGALPESGLQLMRAVNKIFIVSENGFTGPLPSSIRTLSAVTNFQVSTNSFKGALPESGLQVMRAVSIFGVSFNSFKGLLPESGIRTMSAVTKFEVSKNSFVGAIPEIGIGALRVVNTFDVATNDFTGPLPESGIRTMREVTQFHINTNSFKGALPGSGLQVMRAVRWFIVSKNGFTGLLPSSIQTMRAVTNFRVSTNNFKGALPESGLQMMQGVSIDFIVSENSFTGLLPESGIRMMSAVTAFVACINSFEGALPERGFEVMQAVTTIVIHRNRFTGLLPESGIRSMSTVKSFRVSMNSFEGALPEGGVQALRDVRTFNIHTNGFTGLLPGIRSMSTVTCFYISTNSFEGALPGSGVQVMRAVRRFLVSQNGFTGTLPESGLGELRSLNMLVVAHNDFEGAIPSSLAAEVVVLGHNLLAGSIPQQLLEGRTPKYVVANAIHHEGTIPGSARRMTMQEIIVSFGHGLRGLLPKIPGTVSLLSLWENGLEGHLHKLSLIENSTLLVHGNDFSCNLPCHRGVISNSTVSLALIGNHFAQPRRVPEWITPAEQPTDMFCVSNRQSTCLIMLLLCGCSLFMLAATQLKRKTLRMDAKFARARSAWYETRQQQNRWSLASCVLLPFYSNMLKLACVVVADHLRFHVVGMRMPVEVSVVAFIHLLLIQSAARLHDKHVTRMTHLPQNAGLEHHPVLTVHRLWFLVCVISSTPGILYSMVKAVPGFLQVSDTWRWLISNAVALVSGLLTGFGLDFMAGHLSGPSVDSATLQLFGMLFASILLPGLVTILCHAECLGAWTSFWAACRSAWPFAAKFEAVVEIDRQDQIVYCDLVSRSDMCSWRWHVNGRDCMEAAIEHLVWLLYPKIAHYTFTIATFRIMRMRFGRAGMKLAATHVLLKFLWLVMTLFGPCLPILSTLIALLVNIYSILLFGSNAQLLGTDAQRVKANKTDDGACLPSFGFSTVALLACALQSSNLL